MIKELSDEQVQLMHDFREKYLSKVFTNGTKPYDKKVITDRVQNWLYPLIGIKEKPSVIVVDSPYAVQICANLIANTKIGSLVGEKVRHRIWSEVEQVKQEVDQQLRQEVEKQVRNKVDRQIDQQIDEKVRQEVDQLAWEQVVDQVEQVEQQVDQQIWQKVGQVGQLVDQIDWKVDQLVGQLVDQIDWKVDQLVHQQIRQWIWQAVSQKIGQGVDQQVRQEVRQQADQANQQLRQEVWQEVKRQVGDKVWEQVEQVEQQIWRQVGQEVWSLVGEKVRREVGLQTEQVAQQVDQQLGQQINQQVGQVREQVEQGVDEEVRQEVDQQIWDQVDLQLGQEFWQEIWQKIWGQVGEKVRREAREQIWNQVRQKTGGLVGEKVRRGVNEQVNQVSQDVWQEVEQQISKYYTPNLYLRLDDYAWVAYCDFFRAIGVQGLDVIDPVLDILNAGCSYSVAFKNVFIASKHPKNIYRDGENRLHNEHGYAIEYEDGWGFHALHGVRLSPEQHDSIINKKWTFEEVMRLENTEIRVLALEFMGAEEFIEGSGAVLVDTGKLQFISNAEQDHVSIQNKLYEVPAGEIFDTAEYFLKYSDPSTGRIYIEFVPPEIGEMKDADYAMAWRHHCETKEEYYQILQQS